MRYFLITLLILSFAAASFLGSRSDTFSKPPWQVFNDMDDQDKLLPQRSNSFFEDGRTDRPVPDGVVHRGQEIDIKKVFDAEYEDSRFSQDPNAIAINTGLDEEGKPYKGFPIEVNEANLALGQEKYELYCSVCHGLSGDGNGPTKAFGLGNTASFHDPNRQFAALGKPEGAIFNVVSKGFPPGGPWVTGMVPFDDRLSPFERWAVILHIRALQSMRTNNISKLPQRLQTELKELKE